MATLLWCVPKPKHNGFFKLFYASKCHPIVDIIPQSCVYPTLHYAYFILTSLLFSIIFWATSTTTEVTYIDAWVYSCPLSFILLFTAWANEDISSSGQELNHVSIFMTISAMTETGLNTVNLSTLNTFQQALLLVLMLMGSTMFVSWVVVIIRRRSLRGMKVMHQASSEEHAQSRNDYFRLAEYRALCLVCYRISFY